MKIRPQVFLGEVILAVIAIMLVLNAHFEGAVGIAGMVAATMDKLVDNSNVPTI